MRPSELCLSMLVAVAGCTRPPPAPATSADAHVLAPDSQESVADAPAALPDAAPPSPDAAPGPDVDGAVIMGVPTVSGPSIVGSVTIDRAKVLGKIGPGFLGLSFEKSHLTDAFFRPDHAPLVALFRLLGPSILRIGANDADRTTWDPAARPVAGGTISRTVGTVAVDALAAFLKATGWRVIYAVNYKNGTPENAAAEAKYVAAALGGSLYGFELGNEINLAGLPYAAARAKWEALASAVRAQVPTASLIGPATNPGGLQGYLVPFAHDEGAQVVLLTHHYYRGSGTDPASTIEKLVSPDSHLVQVLQTLATAATTNTVRDGFRLGETASFSSHGAAGVSDALAAALWAIDFAFDNAVHGSSGINFHGGGTGMDGNRPFYYAPIGEAKSLVTEARPLYYGMLLLTLAGQGSVLATTAAAGSLNFTAHALASAEGGVSLLLVNKDPTTAVKATVDLGAPASTATTLYLEGPGLAATSGLKVAGAGISPQGAWAPATVYALTPVTATVSLVVPPASAALLRAR